MNKYEVASLGGKATAKILREKAIKDYYINPNICEECGGVIEVKDNQKVSDVRKKKFCNHSCSAKYVNSRRNDAVKDYENIPKYCKLCGVKIEYKFRHNTFCSKECSGTFNNPINEITKEELFAKRSNWQSARSMIQKQARRVYAKSNKEKYCAKCGYNKHYEVAHIKSVSSFNGDVLISEINSLNNLIALCPNCHWEYDNM